MLLLFLMLPALTLADMTVHVLGTFDGGNSNFTAYVSNDDFSIISDTARNAFYLDDSTIKKGFEISLGKSPDEVFVKNPTPWGDVFSKFDWKQVERKTTLMNAGITSARTKSKVIAQQIYENNSTTPMTVNIALIKKKKHVMLSSWPLLDDISAGNLKYKFNVDVKGITMFLNQELAWGESGKKKLNSETFGSKAESTLVLQPNQTVTAQLIVNRGVIKFDFNYDTSICNDVVANYNTEYKGHHFFGCDVNNLLRTIPLPVKLTTTNKIVLAFYYDAKIVVKDNVIGSTLMVKQFSGPTTQDSNRLSGHDNHEDETPLGNKIAVILTDDGMAIDDDEPELDELEDNV